MHFCRVREKEEELEVRRHKSYDDVHFFRVREKESLVTQLPRFYRPDATNTQNSQLIQTNNISHSQVCKLPVAVAHG